MKKLLIVITFLLTFPLIAQQSSNGIDIRSIVAPRPNINYNSNATSDIIVQIINDGGSNILITDSIYLKIKIANNNTTKFIDTTIGNKKHMNPGDWIQDTLINDYFFDADDNYSITVSVHGTKDYPTNTTKNASKTVSFIVGEQEIKKPSIKKIWYKEGVINFLTAKAINKVKVDILDLAGRTLFSKEISIANETQLNFTPPAKGIYFFRLNNNGSIATSKFVVH
jgi:hypothetical protein